MRESEAREKIISLNRFFSASVWRKHWKITEVDWRNREKWDQYEEAVSEMLIRTSTSYAPWIVVEGNCKYYARVKVLETVADAIERRLEEEKKRG